MVSPHKAAASLLALTHVVVDEWKCNGQSVPVREYGIVLAEELALAISNVSLSALNDINRC